MEKLIACCGVNCETCDARMATVNNDDAMRKATAEKWQKLYDAPHISPELIHCMGCRQEGVKFSHWAECGIRKCAATKGYATCGDCEEMEHCETVSPVFKFLPEAIQNLKRLKEN